VTDTIDPTQLVESLDSDRIRQELAVLHRREAALRVLLRAACARERQATRVKSLTTTGKAAAGE
jgi:hypothetical protein